MRSGSCWGVVVWVVLLYAVWPSPASAQTVAWIRQLGTDSYDWGDHVSADGRGYVYISGIVNGHVDGPNAGYYDAFLARIIDEQVVPEPSPLALALTALVCLAVRRRPRG